MGMFDEFRFLAPLPHGGEQREFQTKDLDCQLDVYTVREDGCLWREECSWVGEVVDEAPARFCFDGEIEFYDYNEKLTPMSIGYRATFKGGVLQSVKKQWDDDGAFYAVQRHRRF